MIIIAMSRNHNHDETITQKEKKESGKRLDRSPGDSRGKGRSVGQEVLTQDVIFGGKSGVLGRGK